MDRLRLIIRECNSLTHGMKFKQSTRNASAAALMDLCYEHATSENFGRTFSEWREGHPQCINNKGKEFKGRRCAEKVNVEYRHMQSDLYNLFPAIGAVNALRSNYNFTMLPNSSASFGSCDMQIEGRKVQPPARARGKIARAYLYMDNTYPRFNMSNSQYKLMTAWDKQYPVTEFECHRAIIIERVQGNVNQILKERCKQSGFVGKF